VSDPLENIFVKYESVFHGIRCLRGEYELEDDPSATPIHVCARSIPLSMKDYVKNKLDTQEKSV